MAPDNRYLAAKMDGNGPSTANMAQQQGYQKASHSEDNRGHSPVGMIILYIPIIALAGCVLMLFIFRLLSSLTNRQRLKSAIYQSCQSSFSLPNRGKSALNRHLIYAPLFERRHNREFRICRGRVHMGTIPTRIETILIVAYFALNIVFCLVAVDWSKKLSQSLHTFIGATGTLAVVNLVPLVITAGRNNPFIPLLRISFDTFNLVHRWIGRIVVAEALAHTVAVLVNIGLSKGWSTIPDHLFHRPIFTYGFVATIAFIVILFQSLSPFRHAFYEFFLHLHIVLVAASFAMLWYHLHKFVQKWILLAALLAWATDRMLRLLIVIWRNCGKSLTTASVQVLPGDVARVDITVVRPWKFKAGQYMYLYIPALGLWTSHPFSAAWESVEQSHGSSSPEKSGSSSIKSMLSVDGHEKTKRTVSFLIRKRGGFTKKMLKSVGLVHGYRRRLLALAEGPFGGIHSFNSYGTTLLIAGGIGITHSISYLRELVDGFASGSVATRRITLLWVLRSIDHLQWIQPWMTYILTHPVVQGAVTFSSTSSRAHLQNPFSLENGAHSQNTLSLSVHVHLTTYYSSIDLFNTDPSPATYSSLICREEKKNNNINNQFNDDIDVGHVPSASAYTTPFPNGSISSHHRYHPSSRETSIFSGPCSSSTILNTINNYYTEDESYIPLQDTTLQDTTSPNSSPNTDTQYSTDWTQLSSPAVPITINLGKPLFRQVLEREMAQQIGAMAVSVCGPGGMGDEVRKAVREIQGRKTVEFFEECFSW